MNVLVTVNWFSDYGVEGATFHAGERTAESDEEYGKNLRHEVHKYASQNTRTVEGDCYS